MIVEVITFLIGRAPTMEKIMGVDSLVAAMYSGDYNFLAWMGDYAASKADAGYARIPREAPQDLFYSIIPWAYELLWGQFIYTWDPIWYKMTNEFRKGIAFTKEVNPFSIMKASLKAAYNFDATCPDVAERIMPKMEKIMISIPAWIFYLIFFIVRLILVLYFALVVAIVWVFDFLFGFYIMIRNFFWFYLIFPVFSFFLYLHNLWMWILNIPYMIIELTIRFIFVI
jgi:hypothetical protein